MARSKRRQKPARRGSAKKRIAEIKERLELQRRRAARPMLPVNTQARISESLVERRRKLDRKRAQRKDWEDTET
jgi:hypothetical protein